MLVGLLVGKWRMGWDSNPRYDCSYAGFRDRSLQPLGHPSYGSEIHWYYGFREVSRKVHRILVGGVVRT